MTQIKKGPSEMVLEDEMNNHLPLQLRNELVSTTTGFLKCEEVKDGFLLLFLLVFNIFYSLLRIHFIVELHWES